MLLRRRSCLPGPLLLLGLGLCLYQTLMGAWNRVRSGWPGRSREPLDEQTWRILSYLEDAQVSPVTSPEQGSSSCQRSSSYPWMLRWVTWFEQLQ